MKEKDVQNLLIKKMSNYFHVEDEIWSDDKKSRIDIVMIHFSDIQGKYPIGIEVKQGNKKKGHEMGLWLKQSSTYAEKDFADFGNVIVCTYPQITGLYFQEGTEMHKHNELGHTSLSWQSNVNTFLGAFNVGELQFYYRNEEKYYRIVFNATLIWDEYKDLFRPENYTKWVR